MVIELSKLNPYPKWRRNLKQVRKTRFVVIFYVLLPEDTQYIDDKNQIYSFL
jgi:hypothetical protein